MTLLAQNTASFPPKFHETFCSKYSQFSRQNSMTLLVQNTASFPPKFHGTFCSKHSQFPAKIP
jgi:hypothetical protein